MKLLDSTSGQTFDLTAGKALVGRAADNAIQINNPSVSSHHCEITVDGQQVVIKDMESTNGTFVNGEPVTEAVCGPELLLRLGEVEPLLKADEYVQAAHLAARLVCSAVRIRGETSAPLAGSSSGAPRSARVAMDIHPEAEQ